jgi:hypothetical protein
MSLIEELKEDLNDILDIIDELGAYNYPLFFLTRTWSGVRAGEGTAKDVLTRVVPSPMIRDYSHDIRVQQGGAIQQGDLILRLLSKQSYPTQKHIDGSSDKLNVEKFYYINEGLYRVVSITENYLTWNVQIRKTAHQKTYL